MWRKEGAATVSASEAGLSRRRTVLTLQVLNSMPRQMSLLCIMFTAQVMRSNNPSLRPRRRLDVTVGSQKGLFILPDYYTSGDSYILGIITPLCPSQ